mmetsp:Transcript_7673/g.22635  ORF Transcript_7673/g.22635 Transcript_7673/m.22635 type:complete len:253 (-) Transcript_7673:154-912(-)
MRLAILCTICAGKDKRGNPPINQIHRATILGTNARRILDATPFPQAQVDLVLLESGFNMDQFQDRLSMWDRILHYPRDELSHVTRFKRDPRRFWPLNDIVQKRVDGNCTSLKFHGWALTEYDGILLMDSDACFVEDPRPKMYNFTRDNLYIVCGHERAKRPHDGFIAFRMYFKPNALLSRLMFDKSRYGDFMPYTNGEQDVFETVFPVHLPDSYRSLPRVRHHVGSMPKFAAQCLNLGPNDYNPYANITGVI